MRAEHTGALALGSVSCRTLAARLDRGWRPPCPGSSLMANACPMSLSNVSTETRKRRLSHHGARGKPAARHHDDSPAQESNHAGPRAEEIPQIEEPCGDEVGRDRGAGC